MPEKEKITVRFEARTVRRCDQWIAEANCSSRNEFIEKAVRQTDGRGCYGGMHAPW